MGNLFQLVKLPFTIIPGSIGPVPYDFLLIVGVIIVAIIAIALLVRKGAKKAKPETVAQKPCEAPAATAEPAPEAAPAKKEKPAKPQPAPEAAKED